ncbi:hypothetical protein F5Y14DRAFT_458465 [Nemania sp. NC0429]|nr:hypothetical protein F5Y14DRAFT_458465 [Nemania sp. NC0429]
MSQPPHEAEIERRFVSECLYTLRNPLGIPSFLKTVWNDSISYYAAQDVVDLERAELIQVISYTRTLGIKMAGSTFLLLFMLIFALFKPCKAEEPWTPDDFDWGAFHIAPRDQWNGLYINLTENPLPGNYTLSELAELGRPGSLAGYDVLFLPFLFGFAWQAATFTANLGSAVTTIQGCVTSDGSAWSVAGCVFGLAGTLLSIGSGYQAAKKTGWFARASNSWAGSGLENIELDVFSKRSQDLHQEIHEFLVHEVLSRSFGTPEFLGYVFDGHRLSRRDDEHLHPRAPIFRIHHPRHGLMDIASRQHVNSTRFTISYANHGLAERQSFQHERLSNHLFEGRFDEMAHEADPRHPSFDPAGGYQQIEDSIKCFAQGEWQPGALLSAQMYDTQAQATSGFASMGIFENHDTDSSLQDFTPRGQPLPEPTC